MRRLPVVLIVLASAALPATGIHGAATGPTIVFTGSAGVYLAAADGKGRPQLLMGKAGQPAWSSDGRRLAIRATTPKSESCPESTQQIYVVEPGGKPRQVSSPPADRPCVSFNNPVWSPNGRLIAAVVVDHLGDLNFRYSVAVLPAAGGMSTHVFAARGLRPTWSPDSRALAYTTASGIVVHDLTSPSSRLVAAGSFTDPAWSPTGRRIAFVGPRGIEAVGSDGRGRVVVAPLKKAQAPVWSPKGRTIAFAAGKPPRVYEANPDGSGNRPMTEPVQAAVDPAWSADGMKLAVAVQGGAARGIWALRSSGGGFVRVSKGAFDAEPAWRPR